MKNEIWIKFSEEKRSKWIETDPKAENWSDRGHYADLDPIQRMHIGIPRRIERVYNTAKWRHDRKVIKLSNDEMIAVGYQRMPRDFAGDVILRSDVITGGEPTVQLPAEYGNACVRIYGHDLATMICEGHVIDSTIRGPFRLIGHSSRRGSTVTLTLRS